MIPSLLGSNPRIRHALSFAAKHHSGQRRKTRDVPYIVHPMQVALVLARYGRPDDEIIAAILHDVVEDCAEDHAGQAVLRDKIVDKFGASVAGLVAAVTEPKFASDGSKLDVALRRTLYLAGLVSAPVGAMWICAADKVCNGGDVVVDLLDAANRDAVWNAFSGGKEAVVDWYRRVYTALVGYGFGDAPIMAELRMVAELLESAAITHTIDTLYPE